MSIVKCNNFSTNKLVLKEHMPMLMATFIVCQGRVVKVMLGSHELCFLVLVQNV